MFHRISKPETAESMLHELLLRMCGLDDLCRRFTEKHDGGKPGCGCDYCEGPYGEWIADDLAALLWMIDKVSCTIGSSIRRGGPADTSEN
jgi:hypothetical protein